MPKTTAPKRINEAFAKAIKVSNEVQKQVERIEQVKKKAVEAYCKQVKNYIMSELPDITWYVEESYDMLKVEDVVDGKNVYDFRIFFVWNGKRFRIKAKGKNYWVGIETDGYGDVYRDVKDLSNFKEMIEDLYNEWDKRYNNSKYKNQN